MRASLASRDSFRSCIIQQQKSGIHSRTDHPANLIECKLTILENLIDRDLQTLCKIASNLRALGGHALFYFLLSLICKSCSSRTCFHELWMLETPSTDQVGSRNLTATLTDHPVTAAFTV